MKLPGADYSYGVKSLGRIGPGTAYGAHAEEVLTTQTAKNKVLDEFRKSADAYNAWDEATQTAEANAALVDFQAEVSERETVLRNTPVLMSKDIPEGVDYQKERDGKMVETVQTWEVSPQLMDRTIKESSEKALGRVTNGAIREKLRTQMVGIQSDVTNRVTQDYFKGRHEYIKETTSATIEKAVLADNIPMVEQLVDDAVRTGAYSVAEGRKVVEEATMRSAVASVDKQIGMMDKPNDLDQLAKTIYDTKDPAYAMIPVQERVNLAQRAEARALAIENNLIAKGNASRTQMGNSITNQILLENAKNGYLPTPEELDKYAAILSPSQMKSVIALSNAPVKSDKAYLETFDSGVVEHMQRSMESGISIEAVAQGAKDNLNEAFADGKLTIPDLNQRMAVIDNFVEGPMSTPAYKMAEQELDDFIAPKGSMGSRLAPDKAAVVIKGKRELRQYMIDNPKGSPEQWLMENKPRLRAESDNKVNVKLMNMGITTVTGSDGTLDVNATKASIDAMKKANRMSDDAYKKAINQLNGVN